MSNFDYYLDWNEVRGSRCITPETADNCQQKTRMITYSTTQNGQSRCHCIAIRSRTHFVQLVSLCAGAKLARVSRNDAGPPPAPLAFGRPPPAPLALAPPPPAPQDLVADPAVVQDVRAQEVEFQMPALFP